MCEQLVFPLELMKLYMKNSLLLIGHFLLCLSAAAQEFSFPESVAFDSQSGSYFVTNFNGNCVMKIDESGEKSYFLENIPKPLGTALKGGILYFVTDYKSIKGYSIHDASEVFTVTLGEAVFLNDLCSDDSRYFYASDTRTGKIFQINILDQSYSTFCETGFQGLNGIIYDARKHRLVFCEFSAAGKIGQLNLSTREFSILPVFLGENLDGIAADGTGFFFSSWGQGSFKEGFEKDAGVIYWIDGEFENPKKVITEGDYGPADIFYNPISQVLVIPNALQNSVRFLDLGKPKAGE